uniref:SFRICE_000697 n=1 Tax=Spodoptera frugiperda TaxID=7108 RepID=A0A2H1V0A1_SPOFR
MAYLWMLSQKENIEGDTHMEVGVVHSIIEREKKKMQEFSIVTPWDWQQFIKSCSRNCKIKVVNMETMDFMDFSAFCNGSSAPFVHRKKSIAGGSVPYSAIKQQLYHIEDRDIELIKTVRGTNLCLYKGYSYCHIRSNIKADTNYWRCSSRLARGCKATLILDGQNKITKMVYNNHNHDPPHFSIQGWALSQGHCYDQFLLFDLVRFFPEKKLEFIKTGRGTLCLYKGYTYSQQRSNPKHGTITWRCSSQLSRRCNATLTMDSQKKLKMVSELEFIKTTRGTTLCMYNGYSYCHDRKNQKTGDKHWRCSSRMSRRCKAALVLNDQDKVKMASGDHNHDRPQRNLDFKLNVESENGFMINRLMATDKVSPGNKPGTAQWILVLSPFVLRKQRYSSLALHFS